MGRAINKLVTIAEILKRKHPLHQVTLLESSEIIDVSEASRCSFSNTSCSNFETETRCQQVYEPLEEGLDVVESKRYVSCMTITLSMTSDGLDANDIGYQPPLPHDEIQPGDLNARHEMSNVTRVS